MSGAMAATLGEAEALDHGRMGGAEKLARKGEVGPEQRAVANCAPVFVQDERGKEDVLLFLEIK
jgi:hypothetical protein